MKHKQLYSFIHSFRLRAVMLLVVMFALAGTVWGQSDYSTDYTGNVKLSTTGGTKAGECTVSIQTGLVTTDYDGIKAGTGSVAGAVQITVPSGTKYLHLHAAAWKNETVTLAVTPEGYSDNISLKSDAGVSNNSPFTLASFNLASTDYYKVITFSSALASDTNLTFTASGGKRFVIWGVTAEEEDGDLEDSDLAITGAPVALSFDLYNNSIAQTVTYTTSSTGSITITPATQTDYFSYVHNAVAKTITVTPLAVTPSAQTITISQADDETYKGDNVSFTISITDSTPIPTHTAHFSVNGTIDNNDDCTVEEGASITFPGDPANVNGKTFVGWVTEAIDGTTDEAPSLITSATMGNADVTYYAVFADGEGSPETKADELTSSVTGITTSSYTNFSKKSVTGGSDAVYAGNCAGSNTYIQFRTSSNTGVVSTTSGGKAKKVTLSWSSTADRALQVYGSNTAYTGLSDIFDDEKKGTLLGTLTYGSDTELSITGNYAYIGIKPDASKSGASQLSSITIDWETSGITYSYSNYCTTVAAPVAVTGVTLDKNTATLEVGGTETLTATIAPDDATNKNVAWESSDETVATVENGVVTAVGVGEATITVKSVADNTKTATCTVTVNPTAVTGVSVEATATIKTGKTITLTATVSPDNATNKDVTWTSNNTAVATVSETGVVTGVAAGEATITVTSVSDNTKSATCTVTVLAAGEGTKANPYDVAEALEIISGYSSGSGSDGSVYTKGIVSSVGSMYNSTMLTYSISVDGENTNTVQVFRGKNINNTNFSATSDLSVGDEVIIFGQLYKYNTTPEINTGNYIYSLNGVKIPEITFDAVSYEVAYNGSLTITATADCSGVITYESSNPTIAEINSTTGVVTPHKAGEVTITANIAESANNIADSKDVTLTVTDGRASAGIEFAQASITTTWGESYTGQALTNNNSLTVSYESSVPAVATVDAGTGEVTIVKAGTTIIKANYAGDSSYMPAEVSYTLTVNKAAAGLSFDETEFNIELGDNSFVAPTLNNPNSLTVTWESTDEDVAIILDENGTILYEENAVGTATITASFAGNDWYNAGNASYTINIYDPNAKGTKNNPYTVAEVIDGTATGSDIYVMGYIVGEYVGKTTNPRTSGFTTDANFALADEFTSSPTASGSIPVALPTDALKSVWGNKTNDGTVMGYKVIVKGNKDTYFSVNGIKSTSEVTAVSVPAEVTAAGYATFVAKAAVDFSDSNIKAYVAEPNGTTGVTFTQVGKIPANMGVLLYKAGGATEEIPVTTETSLYVGKNVFVPGEGAAVASVDPENSNLHNYILNNKGGVIGFYRAAGQTVAKNRAYIQIDESTGVKEFITLPGFEDDDVTGIEAINNGQLTMDNEVYDLQGRRVQKPSKGLYIVNGKKVLF